MLPLALVLLLGANGPTSSLVRQQLGKNIRGPSTHINGCPSCATGLVACWPMDGDWSEVVGGHQGTTVGTLAWPAGKLGTYAVQLDGVSGATISGFNNGSIRDTTPYSVSLWAIVGPNTGNLQTLFTSGSTQGLYMNANVQFGIYPLPATYTGVVSSGPWHHLVSTFNGTTIVLYVDGVVGSTDSEPGGLGNPTTIGSNGIIQGLVGTLDEVEFWNRAITPNEVSALYNHGAGVACPFVATADPLFAFAPTSGAGMVGPCALTNATGSKGEVQTVTRASTRWCTQTVASMVAGIATGDLVELPAGILAQEYGGDGTTVLGESVWESRQNVVINNMDLSNPSWSTVGSAVAPILTANAAQGPCGQWDGGACYLGATRIHVEACAGNVYNAVYNLTAYAARDAGNSIYLKGCVDGAADGGCVDGIVAFSDGGYGFSDGGLALGLDGGNGTGSVSLAGVSGSTVMPVAFNPATWVRPCNVQAAQTNITLGCDNLTAQPGHSNTGQALFLAWGAQSEAGATCGPPITTVATAVTRPAETSTFPLVPSTVTTGSMATTVVRPGAVIADTGILNTQTGSFQQMIYNANNGGKASVYTGGVFRAQAGASLTAAGTNRFAAWWDTVNATMSVDGTSVSAAVGTPGAVTTIQIGGYAGSGHAFNGTHKLICYDTATGRCR